MQARSGSNELRRNWDSLGREDPYWAILADPAMRGNRWDLDAFFATGREEIGRYLGVLRDVGAEPRRGRALDFGCGAGRLTLALADHVDRVDGVDIAASMIDLARRHAVGRSSVVYHLNLGDDLALFDDGAFDLIVSIVVLQHMDNDLKRSFLHEFVRVLAPGGVAVFTVPSAPRATPRGLVHRFVPNRALNLYRRRRYGTAGAMEMHAMRRSRVVAEIEAAGAEVVACTPEPMAGPPWTSYLYVVRGRT